MQGSMNELYKKCKRYEATYFDHKSCSSMKFVLFSCKKMPQANKNKEPMGKEAMTFASGI